MSDTWRHQQDFVRNTKGAGASVILILLLSGRSLTSRELQMATGYSDKPVTDALAWLEPRGYVQFNGHYEGWALGRGLARLPFSPLQLGELMRFLANGHTESDSLISGHTKSDSLLDGHTESDSLPSGDRKYSEVGGGDRNISDLGASSFFLSLNKKGKSEEKEGKKEGGGDRNISEVGGGSEAGDDSEEAVAICEWLELGGVALHSPKMATLLASVASVEYVQAHVLQFLHEREAWARMAAHERRGKREPVTGTLIYRIEKGWPSPVMRCEGCLELLTGCKCLGRVPAEYADIIRR